MAQSEQSENDEAIDQVFVDLYDELGEIGHDIKALEFKLRKLAKKLMQRRAVYQRALETIGIKFVESKAREEHS